MEAHSAACGVRLPKSALLTVSGLWPQFSSVQSLSRVRLYADDSTLMVESEGELKNFMKVKEKGEKVGLKLNIQNTKIMESGPITSWQIDGK